MARKSIIAIFISLGLAAVVGYVFWPDSGRKTSFKDLPLEKVEIPALERNNTPSQGGSSEIVVQDLDIPWELTFLPDGSILVSERPGNLVRLKRDSKEEITIVGVAHRGEGGLLGMALHPDFENKKFIYLYLTTSEGNRLSNRVERYVFDPERNMLSEKKEIISGIPGAIYHDGGRIAFGPDGFLYVSTGDAGQENLAQNTGSLAGKILRLKDDGSMPEDNPFGNAIFSYGHRNVQGLAWDNKGGLWATEHGRSGILSGYDELNLIEKGKNYGWPEIQGDETRPRMEKPMAHSGASATWAPSGAAYRDGSIFFAGLRGEALYEYVIDKDKLVEHFKGEYGRLRNVVVGPDKKLYIITNNTDGRGDPKDRDDKIIRLEIP